MAGIKPRSMVRFEQRLNQLYLVFENKYNKYPVQMSRHSAFSNALNDGLISQEEYNRAKLYFGELWNYTGD